MGSTHEAVCADNTESEENIKFHERIRKYSFLIYEVCVIIAITCGKCRNNSNDRGTTKEKKTHSIT